MTKPIIVPPPGTSAVSLRKQTPMERNIWVWRRVEEDTLERLRDETIKTELEQVAYSHFYLLPITL